VPVTTPNWLQSISGLDEEAILPHKKGGWLLYGQFKLEGSQLRGDENEIGIALYGREASFQWKCAILRATEIPTVPSGTSNTYSTKPMRRG